MIIFLYGSDIFRAKEKLEELKSRFLEKKNGNSFLISTTESLDFDLADFRNKVLSSGFFAENKMAILKIQENKKTKKAENKMEEKETLEVIKKIPEETILIVWEQSGDEKFLKSDLGKYLLKQKFIYSFNVLSGNELIGWIRKRVAFYGCEIDNESAILIAEILGNDLCKIDLEINKLCLFIIGSKEIESKKISRKIVEELLSRQAEENIFKFIDALAGKNRRLAFLSLQNELSAGAGELALLGMVVRQIRILLQIKSMQGILKKDEVAKELGIHPYVAQKSLQQARNFQDNELKNIYRGLLQIDMAIKSSSSPARAMFDRLISRI
ncbi:MAG: DNA polymerase III subunit delta [Parcubacteria group bacterium CG10_big_fil_rev_8_21_14_0_10_36_14]|nr:MAG: DNA polymerase III subunit delta [Parcubacteria group bacterium CG10_big_fil_rev_8_21_14_0_10_36_14]